jgi:hypothetical protein
VPLDWYTAYTASNTRKITHEVTATTRINACQSHTKVSAAEKGCADTTGLGGIGGNCGGLGDGVDINSSNVVGSSTLLIVSSVITGVTVVLVEVVVLTFLRAGLATRGVMTLLADVACFCGLANDQSIRNADKGPQ